VTAAKTATPTKLFGDTYQNSYPDINFVKFTKTATPTFPNSVTAAKTATPTRIPNYPQKRLRSKPKKLQTNKKARGVNTRAEKTSTAD
jgi:hypothetical protein